MLQRGSPRGTSTVPPVMGLPLPGCLLPHHAGSRQAAAGSRGRGACLPPCSACLAWGGRTSTWHEQLHQHRPLCIFPAAGLGQPHCPTARVAVQCPAPGQEQRAGQQKVPASSAPARVAGPACELQQVLVWMLQATRVAAGRCLSPWSERMGKAEVAGSGGAAGARGCTLGAREGRALAARREQGALHSAHGSTG